MVEEGPFRVVFFGTPAFAVPTLDALLSSRHTVVGVVSQPDKPRGRGQHSSDAPVKARVITAGLPLLQPEKLRDPGFLERLCALGADIGVVAAYGRILTDAVLSIPRLGLLNVHASLLPRYRGAAPVHRAIIAGEHETGITIIRLVKALDAGPMLATTRRQIDPNETSYELERELAMLGASLLASTLERIAAGSVSETPQDDALATYAPKLTKEDGTIDWSQPARAIHNLIRGLYPWPHAHTFLHARRLILLRSNVSDGGGAGAAPGTVLSAHGDELRVASGHGVVSILELQVEGKRPMGARDFLAGHRVAPGERFLPYA
jgi:methionyl-tRNA formyltransferase